ncbi:MAG: hypothetical protein HXK91_05320 [Lachnospiraceae bacterium]|nr:hypothetical protein [Lachnospiraceae bacterium]
MPVHTYTNWNQRPSDQEEQIEPFRKYFFICEGANTETFYFEHLIDLRQELGIHPLIDIRLWEKTKEDKNISFAKRLVEFAEEQKKNPAIGNLAENVLVAIEQEKKLNQEIHNLKGNVSRNVGKIIEEIINEKPDI